MQSIVVTESSQIAQARRAVTAMAGRQGFNEEDAGRAALVAVEICSNLVKHGGGGELIAQPLERGDSRGVGLIGLDKGQGIADLARCLRDGFSTGGSPGTGLGAINRMSQLFDVYSQPGHGTAVVAQLWPSARAPRALPIEIGAIVVPKPQEVECGDAWCYVERAGGALVMGVDGLGHGLGASQAASMACEVFMTEKTRAPAAVLERIHANLRTTRGAAAIVIDIDWDRRQLLAAGIGNLVAAIVEGNAAKRIPSYNGIVGHATPRIRELSYAITPAATVVFHSDGLTAAWQPERYPGLMQHPCATIAAVLYRDCKRGRDDSMVVALRRAAP
ncbi:MAG TPA: ATP-binding SpoIIE family protein phosphatase [Steroidobacteraceae bacterium]|nr:ATP-binding SpoIIE family protein phosphatase [Steroidobacteraceae bacterium]